MDKQQAANKRKKWIIVAGAFSAIIVIGGGWWWFKSSGVVSTDDASVKNNIVGISAKVSGQIDEMPVKEGDTVQVGQVLAKIDNKSFQIQVEQSQANLASAQAKLDSLKVGNRPQQLAQSGASVDQAGANLENARRNYERIETLYNTGAVSAQQKDTAFTALKVAESQYQATSQGYSLVSEGATEQDIRYAEAQVAQAAAALKSAQLQLDNSVIVAPIAGVVAKVTVDQGEIVSVGQPIFSITNPSDSWVEANIEETAIGKVQLGQTVSFTIDAYPGKTLLGEVSDVGIATGSQFSLLPADNASGNFTKVTQRLTVKIKVNDAENAVLKPGMSAVVDIHVR
ncbi:multidrug resistance efflux pump [Sporomusaceae bacterium BoRhaA]|uniref:HlyD family secretion protein n=1 Tax=Pelorhabdus rhamnosifermentans TaxID=2772457 RepID=UPI001C05F305|nr:HlyD family secretion protein [Pelorhabdus rhamnosifermentans]MBU2699854.1 multidrug resistance efflux pump [Pelorhabdus rhamnosifermentans]